MSILLSCHNVSKTFGLDHLFTGVTFGLEERDKVAIIGPNGSGKSSLLKILAQVLEPDEGSVSVRKGKRLVYIDQQSSFAPHLTITEAIKQACPQKDRESDDLRVRINIIISKVGFADGEQLVTSLSGGWQKRLSIACALIQEPDILLLDEPTNHLDLEGILWLENLLKSSNFAYIIISHDRYFLENTSNRTIELNRTYPGGMFTAQGSYSQFLAFKAEYLIAQQNQQESLANKVRREVEWLQRGPKARSTKQQARIQAAEGLQSELADMNSRMRQGSVNIDFLSSQRKTKKLIHLQAVSKKLGEKQLLKDLDLTLSPGMRLGLLGLNASGKTTLLKILSGALSQDSGKVDRADNLKLVYFEQTRESLNPETSLKRTLAPHGDSVLVNDRSMHVVSWAKKFLFRPEQLDVPVGKLSGGERARLLIAKLMLEPADVLLLDEPTNDLDIQTLEVLEDSLMEFVGAVVLVTHDRFMLDRVSNLLLALDGKGKTEYFADYLQWQNAQKELKNKDSYRSEKSTSSSSESKISKKLSYNEQREFEQMEKKIADAEATLMHCQEQSEDPIIQSSASRLQEVYATMKTAQDEVERLYTRWAELEAKIK